MFKPFRLDLVSKSSTVYLAYIVQIDTPANLDELLILGEAVVELLVEEVEASERKNELF